MTAPRFDFTRDELLPVDTHILHPEEQGRLSGQNARILERLRQGPASNRELAELSLKYTSRLSDIRRALEPKGKTVTCIERNHRTGFSRYAITDLERK